MVNIHDIGRLLHDTIRKINGSPKDALRPTGYFIIPKYISDQFVEGLYRSVSFY